MDDRRAEGSARLRQIVEEREQGKNRECSTLDLILDTMRYLQVRTTSIEANMGPMNKRLDSMDLRIDRIEKRMELAD